MAQQEDAGKMFVGGISSDTTQASLKEYFDSFGEVVNSVLMVDSETKRSRGFGFVTFRDPLCVHKVEECPSHVLDGKQIDPKRAVPKGPGQSAILKQMNEHSWSGGPIGGGGGGNGPSNFRNGNRNPNKIFVGGVGQNTNDEQLREYFSTFGEVVEVRMPQDKKTGNHRGFAFVGFLSPEPVAKTRGIHYHLINGKTVEVKSLDQAQNGGGMGAGMGLGMSGGMGGGGGRPPMGGAYDGYGLHHDSMNGGQHPYLYGGQGYPQQLGRGYGNYGGYGVGQQAGYGQAPGASAAPSNPYGAYGSASAAAYGDHHAAMAYGHAAPASAYAAGSYGSLTAPPSSSLSGYGSSPAAPATAPQQPAAQQQQQPDAASADLRYNPLYGLGNYAQDSTNYGPSRSSYSGGDLSSYGAASAASPLAGGYPVAPTAGGVYGNSSVAAVAAAAYGRSVIAASVVAQRGSYHPYGR